MARGRQSSSQPWQTPGLEARLRGRLGATRADRCDLVGDAAYLKRVDEGDTAPSLTTSRSVCGSQAGRPSLSGPALRRRSGGDVMFQATLDPQRGRARRGRHSSARCGRRHHRTNASRTSMCRPSSTVSTGKGGHCFAKIGRSEAARFFRRPLLRYAAAVVAWERRREKSVSPSPVRNRSGLPSTRGLRAVSVGTTPVLRRLRGRQFRGLASAMRSAQRRMRSSRADA